MIRHAFFLHSNNTIDADVIRAIGEYPRNPRAEMLRRWIALSASVSGSTTYNEFLTMFPYIEDGISIKFEVRCCRELPESDSVRSVFKEVADLSYKQRDNTLRGHILRGYLIETTKDYSSHINETLHLVSHKEIAKPIVQAVESIVAIDVSPIVKKQRPDIKGLMGKRST